MASCRASAKGRDAEAGIVSDLLALSLALDDSLAAGIGKEALLTPQQVRCSKAAHHSGWDLVEIDSKMIQQRFVLQTIGSGCFAASAMCSCLNLSTNPNQRRCPSSVMEDVRSTVVPWP